MADCVLLRVRRPSTPGICYGDRDLSREELIYGLRVSYWPLYGLTRFPQVLDGDLWWPRGLPLCLADLLALETTY